MQTRGVYHHAEFLKVVGVAELMQREGLIDRGRLFFPNRKHGDYGMDKEPGFQGRRHKALDVLVHAYGVIDAAGDAPGPDRETSDKLTAHRRKFMAEIFTSVDPVRRGENMKELT
jgi:hypothetical protein